MRDMNILLIQPWSKESRVFRRRLSCRITTYAPLALATLAALVPKDLDYTVEVCDEIAGEVCYDKKHYDLVGITVLTPFANRAYSMAEEFKKRGSYVVMGGYHPTYMPEEALQHADTVIMGAGELSWPKFLRDFAAGAPEKIYDMQRVRGEDMVTPDRSVIPKHRYLKYPAIIANRGCAHNCDFCVISDMWRGCTPRPVEAVIEEIKSLNSKVIEFFDPNFFAARDYAVRLMTELKKLKIKWACAANIGVAYDTELMQLARQSGCSGFLVGLESLNPETLKNSNKGFNDPNKYKEAISIIQSYGMSVLGCFVLGMDGDTEELLLSIPEQAKYLNLNLVKFSILTPVPNSPLFNRLDSEGRILTRDWDKYNQNEVVFKPLNMSPERLKEIYCRAWKETYSFKNMMYRFTHLNNKTLFEKAICIGANIGFKFLETI